MKIIWAAAVLLLLVPNYGRAEIPDGKIKIGLLQDLTGPVTNETGNGGLVAAQLAAADFEKRYLRGDAEILPGATSGTLAHVLDHVRDWLDKEHVAAVLSSAGPLIDREVARMVEKRHRTLLVASTDAGMAGLLCSPNTILWGDGAGARARALAMALVPLGGKRWFILGDDDPSGIAEQAALKGAVPAAGGQIVGTIDDMTSGSDLAKAETKIAAANPQVVVLTQSDGDLIDAIRAAHSATPTYHATFAAPFARLVDIDNAGVTASSGLAVVAPFYWNTNDATRAFAKRWEERMSVSQVDDNAAEIYAATLSFLNAAKAVEDVDSAKVTAEMRRAPIKSALFGTVRVEPDGRVLHDLTVYTVKPAGEVEKRWEYYQKLTTVPGDKAFPPQTCHKK